MNQFKKMDHSDRLSAAAIGYDGAILQDIHLPNKNIALYRRSIEPLNDALVEMAQKSIECRASGSPEEIIPKLEAYFSEHFTNYAPVLDDIVEILRLFENVTQAASFRLLLATISTNMCRKFHTDVNDLRLLCTYIGPGTLWLPSEAVDLKTLKAGGDDLQTALDPQHIQQAQTGDLVILKGALYPDANPVLHRSPTIEGKGEKRLLLRIDTNEFQNF